MFQLIKTENQPINKEFERLYQFCEGLIRQKQNLELFQLKKEIIRYCRIMELGLKRFQIEIEDNQLRFKYHRNSDYYLSINKNQSTNNAN